MVIAELFELSGKVLIPTLAQTDDGFYLMVEPVAVLDRPGVEDLIHALRKVEQGGNPRIPNPERNKFPPPVLLPHVAVKTWRTFERRARSWGLRLGADTVTVINHTKQSDGGTLGNLGDEIEFGGTDPHRAAAQWIYEQIRF